MLSRLFPRLLLIFALLFAQLGGYAHGLSHTLSGQNQEHSLAHEKHCELCAEYAQLGGALASQIPSLAMPLQHGDLLVIAACPFHSSCFAAYPARAPPYSA